MTDLATQLAYNLSRTAAVTATTVQVATVAAARLLPEPASGALLVTGYRTTVGDDGSGLFVWEPSNTTDDDGSLYLQLSGVSTGRFVRQHNSIYDIRWFGGVGDNSTDCTTPIANAVAAIVAAGGGSLFFPTGTYKITSSTALSSGVPLELLGAGDQSVIRCTNSTESLFTASQSAAMLSIRKLAFSGTYGRVLRAIGCSAVLVEDCDISGGCTIIPSANVAAIIDLENCTDVWVWGNYFHANGETGAKTSRTYHVYLAGSTLVSRQSVRNNTIVSSDCTVGIGIFNPTQSEIIGNVVDMGGADSIHDAIGGDGYPILAYNTNLGTSQREIRIENNDVSNGAGSGIYVQDIDRCVVANNVITACALTQYAEGSLSVGGIAIAASDETVAVNNVIRDTIRPGIVCSGNRVRIAGNQFLTTAAEAIRMAGSLTGGIVEGNVVQQTRGTMATVVGGAIDFGSLAAGQTLQLKINGGATVTTTLQSSDLTGTNAQVGSKIAYRINTAHSSVVAAHGLDTPDHKLMLMGRGAYGASSSVQVVGGTAMTALGFTAATTSGTTSNGITTSFSAILTQWHFSGNQIRSITGQGLAVTNSIECKYLGNHVSASGLQQVAIGGGSSTSRDNLIAHNHVLDGTQRGFDIRAIDTIVQANKSVGNTTQGIYFHTNTQNCQLLDNDLTGNGSAILDSGTNLHRRGNIVSSKTSARSGTATLVAGSVVVTTAEVTASSKIRLTRATTGGTPGHLSYTISAGASFTITSSSGTETSTVDWEIVH